MGFTAVAAFLTPLTPLVRHVYITISLYQLLILVNKTVHNIFIKTHGIIVVIHVTVTVEIAPLQTKLRVPTVEVVAFSSLISREDTV